MGPEGTLTHTRAFFSLSLLLLVFLGGVYTTSAQEEPGGQVKSSNAQSKAADQIPSLEEWNRQRVNIQKNGMYVLGSWALGNFAVSGYCMTKSRDRNFYFHQMNVFWNVVNLGIAGIGYAGALQSPLGLGLERTVEEYRSFGRILGINAALDVGYVMTGLFLKSRGKKSDSHSERLIGYGNSLVLQGSFLFVFDVTLAYINRYALAKMGEAYSLEISAVPWGLRVRFGW
ncbi:MAG: hypothetical protein K9L66_01370 [Spirochaetaceae bacterium]|nr:hypothetical protein [Spirochaetaceae bacterium]MCF7947225.1 hypothetical protein [Spirochaetia bacterium]MCF7950264.1 hypothetical protein [Spirochaetaceae bacterium]